jgi:hypothetical protein
VSSFGYHGRGRIAALGGRADPWWTVELARRNDDDVSRACLLSPFRGIEIDKVNYRQLGQNELRRQAIEEKDNLRKIADGGPHRPRPGWSRVFRASSILSCHADRRENACPFFSFFSFNSEEATRYFMQVRSSLCPSQKRMIS